MSNITAADVNKLRQATGAGMMDCKKALVEAEGDFDKAIDVLRKKGQKVAANRADRDSSEGAVICKFNADNTHGAMISLNCETDFVAKNESFVQLANELAQLAVDSGSSSKEEFLQKDFKGMTVEEKLTEQTGVIGEKIEIGAFETLDGDYVGGYIHAGNKIAAMVSLNKAIPNAEEVTKNVAMQVAAMNPVSLDSDSVTEDIIARELEVGRELAIQEGKPAEMADKIAQGRLGKFFKENTLVSQAYIKDGSMSVEEYVKSGDKETKVMAFKRYGLS